MSSKDSKESLQTDVSAVTSRLARFLHATAGAEPVRTCEALAAAIVNQASYPLASETARSDAGSHIRRAARLAACVDATCSQPLAAAPDPDDPLYASCLRVARRAIAGALRDPTAGAVRFHALAHRPSWAEGLSPKALIGSFLFYDGDPQTSREEQLLGHGTRHDRAGRELRV